MITKEEGLKINLGCGNIFIEGFVGIDNSLFSKADKIMDLEDVWEIEDNSVEYIIANDIIEHLSNPIHTMNEIWRVCRDGAIAELQIPTTDGRGAFQDPTHRSFWNANSFCYYCESLGQLHLGRQYGFIGNFDIVSFNEKYVGDPTMRIIEMNVRLRVKKTNA